MKKTIETMQECFRIEVSELENGNALFQVDSLKDLVPILRAIDPRYGGSGKIEVTGTDDEDAPAVFELSGDDDTISARRTEIFNKQKITSTAEWIDGELIIARVAAAKISKTDTNFKLEFGNELFFSERSYAKLAADLIFEIGYNKAHLSWFGDELRIAQTPLTVASITEDCDGNCDTDCCQPRFYVCEWNKKGDGLFETRRNESGRECTET